MTNTNIVNSPKAEKQVTESDSFNKSSFSNRDTDIIEFKPTNGIIRVFEIATKGPTNKGLLNDFSDFEMNRAA